MLEDMMLWCIIRAVLRMVWQDDRSIWPAPVSHVFIAQCCSSSTAQIVFKWLSTILDPVMSLEHLRSLHSLSLSDSLPFLTLQCHSNTSDHCTACLQVTHYYSWPCDVTQTPQITVQLVIKWLITILDPVMSLEHLRSLHSLSSSDSLPSLTLWCHLNTSDHDIVC
jgi:hypothetical protein